MCHDAPFFQNGVRHAPLNQKNTTPFMQTTSHNHNDGVRLRINAKQKAYPENLLVRIRVMAEVSPLYSIQTGDEDP